MSWREFTEILELTVILTIVRLFVFLKVEQTHNQLCFSVAEINLAFKMPNFDIWCYVIAEVIDGSLHLV